jgi:NTE family protein
MGGQDRVALVLGAGGPVGSAFHAGVLGALAAAGWAAGDADLIVGTSIGAVVGGLLRAGMVPDDLLARALGEPLSDPGEALVRQGGGWPNLAAVMAGHDGRGPLSLPLRLPSAPTLLFHLLRDPRRIRAGLVLAGLLPTGDVEPGAIAAAFDAVIGGEWPTQDLWVCTTDLDRGLRVVFGAPGAPRATVGTAVAASSSVPSVFAPVVVDGRRYVDGGAHSPANTDVLAPLAGDLAAVVVSLPMGIGAWPGRGGADLPGRWLNHIEAWRGLDAVRRAGVPVLLVEPGPDELEVMGYDAFDLTHRPEIAVRARDSTAARLKEPHPIRSVLGLA